MREQQEPIVCETKERKKRESSQYGEEEMRKLTGGSFDIFIIEERYLLFNISKFKGNGGEYFIQRYEKRYALNEEKTHESSYNC